VGALKRIDIIKRKLGICDCKGCLRKVNVEIDIPAIQEERHLCNKHYKKLKSLEVFNFKERSEGKWTI